jgi:hypothetical protein
MAQNYVPQPPWGVDVDPRKSQQRNRVMPDAIFSKDDEKMLFACVAENSERKYQMFAMILTRS